MTSSHVSRVAKKNQTNVRLTSVPECFFFCSLPIANGFRITFLKSASRYGFLLACFVWLPALGALVFFVQHENQTNEFVRTLIIDPDTASDLVETDS